MNLNIALRVPDRGVVAFVGGGGKTSALYRLAAEWSEPGVGRILITTTAKMLLPQPGEADGLFIHADFDTIAQRLEETIPFLRRIAIAPDVLESAEGWKMQSAPLDWPKRLSRLVRVSGVLVEADGSRHLPFKAPSHSEPPIPHEVDIVVVVVGLDILGQPLDEAHVHRPECVAGLSNTPLGAPVTVDTIARTLTHPEGGLKNVPPAASLVALLNKVTNENIETARELGRLILKGDVPYPPTPSPTEGGRGDLFPLLPEWERGLGGEGSVFDTILIGSVQNDDPIRERQVRLGAVVLAAGGASRYGAPKQTLAWQGTTFVGHSLDLAYASGASEIVLVTGAYAEAVSAAVSGYGSLRIVHNDHWSQGLSTSVRTGLQALSHRTHAALFLLADQPSVTPEIAQALVQRYYETAAPIVVPTYRGRRGNPTLWDRSMWAELSQISGDQGGRSLIEKYREQAQFVEVGEAAMIDVDTPEDYGRLNA